LTLESYGAQQASGAFIYYWDIHNLSLPSITVTEFLTWTLPLCSTCGDVSLIDVTLFFGQPSYTLSSGQSLPIQSAPILNLPGIPNSPWQLRSTGTNYTGQDGVSIVIGVDCVPGTADCFFDEPNGDLWHRSGQNVSIAGPNSGGGTAAPEPLPLSTAGVVLVAMSLLARRYGRRRRG
jgi:hypothetical protein